MICYVTLRYITLDYITLRYITLHYVTLRYVTLRYVTLRYVTLGESGLAAAVVRNDYNGWLISCLNRYSMVCPFNSRKVKAGNTKEGSITIWLTSCLTGLESAV
jgi:hypothetical protein